jgi:serine/threonine protein kinase/WD40 repeat protein
VSEPSFHRVEELFHEALALPPKQRAAYLDKVCAGDVRMRAAVEELLRHDRDDGAAEESLVSPVARELDKLRLGPPTLPDPREHGSGAVVPPSLHIPGYELLEELGRGGMGVVYKARQTSLGRIVALKMLLPAIPVDAQTLARFRTEAEALARLHYPNIVPIYDIGEYEGRPFFSMEYVAGPSLAMYLEGRPQDPHASAALIETLARAIHTVHQCGIIHRDLKPANVLLQMENGEWRMEKEGPRVSTLPILQSPFSVPKITDFGLAKDQNIARQLTLTGTTMGTPSYMAPEQARSKGEDVGPATDIYALGSILYEMLTGRPPFDEPTPAETIAALLYEEPESPSRLQPRVPRDLATICLRCLEKPPRRRYASALDLAEDLQRFQSGKPILARPVGPLGHAYRWCLRRPLVAGLVALSGILAVAFVITVLILYARLRDNAAQLKRKTEEQHDQIIQLNINIGIIYLEEEDAFAALLRFAEALHQEEGDSEREHNDRMRIATILRQCPRLDRLITLDKQVVCSRMGASSGWVATVDQHNAVEVWDLPEGRLIHKASKQQTTPVDGEFSADGQFLATLNEAGAVHIWDLRTERSYDLPSQDIASAKHVFFHADSPILTTQHADGTIRFWDLRANEPVLMNTLDGNDTKIAAVDEEGRWCIRVTRGLEAQEWDTKTGKLAGPPWKLPPGVRGGAISADGRRVALLGPDETLEIRDAADGQLLNAAIKPHDGVREVLLSPDGEKVLTVNGNGLAQVWQMHSGQLLAEWPKVKSVAGCTHFSQAGRLVIMHDGDGVAEIVDAATGQMIVPPLRHVHNLVMAALSADGNQLITVGKHGVICTWTLPTLPPPHSADSLEQELSADRAASAEGATERIALKNGVRIQVKKRTTDGALHPPDHAEQLVERAAFSPDGRLVAVAVDDKTVEVWNVLTGEVVTRPLRHRRAVRHAAFSADSRHLVTATEGGTVRVWDARTGEVLAPSIPHAQPIERVVFSSDGRRILVVHEGKKVTTWDVTPEERSVEDLLYLAQVDACGVIDKKQEYGKMNAGSLREIWDKLHGNDH